MRHIKLILEYDGTNYAGWQSQKNGLAIQDVVSESIQKMVEEKIILTGASRTDAGVHAWGQVATFKTTRDIPCHGFLRGLNLYLPEDIRVVGCEEAPIDFHPIREAKQKTYEYLLGEGPSPPALRRHHLWWVGPGLDVAAMEKGSSHLIGEHDFKSFQAAGSEVLSSTRKLEKIIFSRPAGEVLLKIQFAGNGFLKQMIRNIVGTLVDVGLGKREPSEIKIILETKDRTKAGFCAPPQGLYLVKVEY